MMHTGYLFLLKAVTFITGYHFGRLSGKKSCLSHPQSFQIVVAAELQSICFLFPCLSDLILQGLRWVVKTARGRELETEIKPCVVSSYLWIDPYTMYLASRQAHEPWSCWTPIKTCWPQPRFHWLEVVVAWQFCGGDLNEEPRSLCGQLVETNGQLLCVLSIPISISLN